MNGIDDGKVIIDVDIDTKPLEKGLDKAKETLQELAKEATTAGGNIDTALSKVDTVPLVKGVKDVETGLKDSGKQASFFGDMLKANLASEAIIGGIRTLSGAIVGVFSFAASGLQELAKIGIEYNSQMQNYQVNFSTLLGSQEAAIQKIQELKVMAAATPFEMADLAKGTETLLAFGIESGRTGTILQQLGDISLGNKDKFNGLNLAYAQVASTGRLMGQDLNQMINQGFNPLLEISKTTGESMAELKDRMSDGAISAQEVALAFTAATSEGGMFYQGMQNASQTLDGTISTLKDNFNALVGEVFMPLSQMFLSELVPLASEFVASLQSAFEGGGIEGLAAGFGGVVAEMIVYVAEQIPEMIAVGQEFLQGFVEGLIENQDQIISAAGEIGTTLIDSILPSGAADLLYDGIDLIVQAFGFLDENSEAVTTTLIALTTAFVTFQAVLKISSLIAAVTTAMNGMTAAQYLATQGQKLLNLAMAANPIGIVIAIVAALAAAFVYLWNTNEDFRVAFLTAWANILNFFDGVPLFFQGIGDGISNAFGKAKTFVLTVMQNMVNGIIDIVNIGLEALNFLSAGAIKPLEYATFATENAVNEAEKTAKRSADYASKSAENATKATARISELQAMAKTKSKEVGDSLGENITAGAIDKIDTKAIVDTGTVAGEGFSQNLGEGIKAGSGGATAAAKDTAKEIKNTQQEEFEEMAKQAEGLHKDLMQAQANIYKEDLSNFEINIKEQITLLDEATKEKKELYAEERDAKLEALGISSEAKDTGFEAQINAIKEAAAARKKARELEKEAEAIAKAEEEVRDAEDTEDRIKQEEKLADLIAKRQERQLADSEAARIKELELKQKGNDEATKIEEKAIKDSFDKNVKKVEDDTKLTKDGLSAQLKEKQADIKDKLKEENLYHDASKLLVENNQIKIQGVLREGNVKTSILGKQGGAGFMASLSEGFEEGQEKFDEDLQNILDKIKENNRKIAEENKRAADEADEAGTTTPEDPPRTSIMYSAPIALNVPPLVPMVQSVVINQTNNVVAQETPGETYRRLRDLGLGYDF